MENKSICMQACQLAWRPIIAGAVVSIGLSFLLNLFSVAIGLTVFTTDSAGIEALALGGLVATALGIVVSMFASGWIAGYLGRSYCSGRHLGALYGFLAWVLALIMLIFLASYEQKYISFYANTISDNTHAMVEMNHFAEKPATANMKSPAVTMKANESDATRAVVVSSYILFSLFFLSAFASSLGGHAGMRYHYKKDMCC